MLPMMAGYLLGGAAADWWAVPGKTCVVAYQPKGAASLAASYTNLANPGTYNAAPGNAPTWASGTGWGFVVSSLQYLISSGFTIPNNQTATVIIRYSDGAATGRGFLFGFASEFGIQPYFDGVAKRYRSRGGSQINYTPAATSGVFATAGLSNYFNGGFLGNHTAFSAGSDITSFAIGAQSATSPGNYLTGNVQAFAIYSDTFSGAEVATLSAAMAAL